jgi:hypothetical protein
VIDVKNFVVNYLNKKKDELKDQSIQVTYERELLKKTGHYRKLSSTQHSINSFDMRIKSSEKIITMLEDMIFSSEYVNVKTLLSPYGVFCDRTTFYYNEKLLCKYNEDHQAQIIMCEFFNSFQNYYVNDNISESMKKKCRGRSLTCLYYIGIIKEYVPVLIYGEEEIVKFFNIDNPSSQIITYEPNCNAAKYLFNKLIWESDIALGVIVERWEQCESLIITIRPYGLGITEVTGIEFSSFIYNDRKIYYLKTESGYRRSSHNNKIILRDSETIEITKKIIE